MQRALQLNPDSPDALGNLGHLLAVRREPAQAAFYFARSVQLKPNDSEVRTNYAVTLASLKRLDEARQQIDAAVKADPKSSDAHNVKGSILEQTGNRAEALREFLEAIRLTGFRDRTHPRRSRSRRQRRSRRRRTTPSSGSRRRRP